MKNLLIVLFLICPKPFLYAQTYEYAKAVTPEEKKNFLGLNEEIFALSSTIFTGISDADTETSVNTMASQIQYSQPYLEKIQGLLKKDSLNPYYLNDMAMYYEVNQNQALARDYFQKAKKNLSQLVTAKKDSARFYSLRGLIKVHLMEKEPMADMEKAMRINPLDSLANAFYPIFLLSERKYDQIRQLCTNKLDANEMPKLYYVLLFSSYLGDIQALASDEAKLKANATKEYDQLLDYSLVNKYAEKYKDNVNIQNARYMIEVSALFYKMFSFELNYTETAFILKYSDREKKKIEELIKVFNERMASKKINPYTANKCLSILYSLQGKSDKVIETEKKAIAALPYDKQRMGFNTNENYDMLLSIYNEKEDYKEYKKILEEKIEKAYDKTSLSEDYKKLALIYLFQNDIEKADEWCRKSKALNSEDFGCLRLMSHLYFLKENYSLSQYYAETAIKYMESNTQSAWLSLQTSISMIIVGDSASAQSAYENIVAAKKGLDGDCKLCDELISKYIKIKP